MFRRQALMGKKNGEGGMNSFTIFRSSRSFQVVMVFIGNGLSLGAAVATHVKVHPVPFAFGKKT